MEIYDLKIREGLEGRFGILNYDNWKFLAWVHQSGEKDCITYFPLALDEFDKEPQEIKRKVDSLMIMETICEDYWNNELKQFAEEYKRYSRIH